MQDYNIKMSMTCGHTTTVTAVTRNAQKHVSLTLSAPQSRHIPSPYKDDCASSPPPFGPM